ncbi:LysR family transcriptional regulator [Variovorax gossypii]
MTLDGRLLSNVSVLAAVVEGGSFANAATALGLTPSGVSRSIARLEARIGVRLFDRTTRSLNLTDEGRLLYANINPLVLGIEDAVTIASGASGAVRGRLRVNTDAFTSRLLLARHLPRFLAQYPELTLELIAREQLGRVNTNSDCVHCGGYFGAWRSHPSNSPRLSTACPSSVATSA